MTDIPKSLKVDVTNDHKQRFSEETQESLDKLVQALNQGYDSPSDDNTKEIIEAKSELSESVKGDYIAFEQAKESERNAKGLPENLRDNFVPERGAVEANGISKVISENLSERAKEKVISKANKDKKSPAKGSWAEKALDKDNHGSGASHSI